LVVSGWEDREVTPGVPAGGAFCGQAGDTTSTQRAMNDASWRSDGVIGSLKLRPSTLTLSLQTSFETCGLCGARACVHTVAPKAALPSPQAGARWVWSPYNK